MPDSWPEPAALHETLTKIMNSQSDMKNLIDTLSSRINHIESSLLSQSSSSGSSSTEKEVQKVSPELSVSFYYIICICNLMYMAVEINSTDS